MRPTKVIFIVSVSGTTGSYGAGEEHIVPEKWALQLQENEQAKIVGRDYSTATRPQPEKAIAPSPAAAVQPKRETRGKGR